MVDYVRLAATAQRLVEANGRSVTAYKTNRTPDNPAEPWRGTSSTPSTGAGGDSAPLIIAFVPPRGTGLGKLLERADGTLLDTIEQVGLLAADTVPAGDDIESFDQVLDGSTLYKIEQRETLKPGDTAVLHVLGLSKAS